MKIIAWLAAMMVAAWLGHPIQAADHPVAPSSVTSASKYTVAVYYWPNFHCDSFHESKKGKGWTEWHIVKNAKPRFKGHDQPKQPLWGYRDESDPKEMANSIDAMANAGIDVVIFDWYRYGDDIHEGRMLEDALEKGFLRAANRQRIKFALMWANHTYVDCHPFAPGKSFHNAEVWRKGEVSRAAFDRHTDDAIRSYFSQPNYWKIDGKPYFSIYYPYLLIRGLGGLEPTRAALDGFRARVRAAGHPGLHLNFVDWSLDKSLDLVRGQPMPGDPSRTVQTIHDLLTALGVDSSTMYTWAHHAFAGLAPAKAKSDGPTAPLVENAIRAGVVVYNYADWGQRGIDLQSVRAKLLGIPYFPHVAVGWDGSPRNYSSGITVGGTPELFRDFLRQAKIFLDTHPTSLGVLTINSWNEWVEGSYLEPDVKHGTKYLDAVRDVFGPNAR